MICEVIWDTKDTGKGLACVTESQMGEEKERGRSKLGTV